MLTAMRRMGVATVSYMIDNPFGPRRDPGWRLYMKDIPYYDLHVVQRDKNILDYRQRGARDVIKIQTAYEPTIHYPPPAGWSDANRDREVSFIGTPYDDRADTLTKLSDLNQLPGRHLRQRPPLEARPRPRPLPPTLPRGRALPAAVSRGHLALATST